MSAPSVRPQEALVFAPSSSSAWLGAGSLHIALGLVGSLFLSVHTTHTPTIADTTVVSFDVPPPPPPRRPPPPTLANNTPTPAQTLRTPTPAPRARSVRRIAPPPLLTAHTAVPTDNTVATGTNTEARTGNTSADGTSGAGAPATPAPVVAEAPATPRVPTGPVRLPENAEPPEPLNDNVTPEYPASARSAGIQGTVLLRIVVENDGHVARAEVLRGPEELQEAARSAVLRWRFRPARFEGTPLAVYQIVRVPFVLENM